MKTSDRQVQVRKAASCALFWGAIAVIGVIAIPTAILIGIILAIWKCADFLLIRLDRGGFGSKQNFFRKN